MEKDKIEWKIKNVSIINGDDISIVGRYQKDKHLDVAIKVNQIKTCLKCFLFLLHRLFLTFLKLFSFTRGVEGNTS